MTKEEAIQELLNIQKFNYTLASNEVFDMAIKALEQEPKTGRWELAEDGWYCSACELYPPFDCDPEEKGIPYCPYCGAKMEVEHED